MHLFHVPALDTGEVFLTDEEAHHALHVLRLKPGAVIGLLDGRGTRATADLVLVDKRRVAARITQREVLPAERRARIHLAVAPTKQADRFAWFVEKAVEVGVDRLTPLITTRTERTRVEPARLLRLAIAAMKQSQRVWLPTIDAATTLPVLIGSPLPTQCYFGWCEGEHTSLMERYAPGTDALVLIGPEGDFTTDEVDRLHSAGFAPVSMGSARLRTETAALAACTWMSLAQQR